MQVDDAFNNLRHKLDVLGYSQTFPLSAFAIVGALFEDLVKTTESLRDAKLRIGKLLEEKACWELGVEPYKCDNSRLLAECNSLHLEVIRQSEEFDNKELELSSRLRKAEADKSYLQEHCVGLENRIRELISKVSDPKSLKHKKDGVNMSKKPFVSTVPVGTLLPNPHAEFGDKTRCPKCNHIAWAKHSDAVAGYDIRQVQNEKKDLLQQIASYKRKVEIRDREISRLHELLSGGRPPAALAKDCCYKNFEILNEDVDVLQKEKLEMAKQLRTSQEKMHEAMQRAVKLEEDNKLLSKQLKDLQHTALRVEKQANIDIIEKDQEISQLKHELRHLKLKSQTAEERFCKTCSAKTYMPNGIRSKSNSNICQKCILQKDLDKSLAESKKLENEIQILLEKERDMSEELGKLNCKNLELKQKVTELEKEKVDMQRKEVNSMYDDDDYNRMKLERDFFQKEYLQIVKKSANEKEVENLQAQLKIKDQEVKKLRHELLEAKMPTSARSDHSISNASVQATILRAERERDAVKSALSLAQMEKESLVESLKITKQASLSEKDRYEQEIKEKEVCIQELKTEIRKIKSGLGWQNSLKEQNEELNKKVAELENENTRLLSLYNKLKILQEQTERALIDHQNRLVASESQLENATSRLNTLDTSRESARNESTLLRNTVSELKSRSHLLENEKESLIMDLDVKTEKISRLETELRIALKNKEDFAVKVEKLQNRLEQVQYATKERENEYENSTLESKTLRKELAAIKLTRDQTLEENNRIISELADANAELALVQHRLKESQREVDNLKLQLQQYVQEVQRAEELLLLKEREREEMLEHYRSLTHDAVVLEGTHHSLEMEAAEQKRLLAEADLEIIRLKKEMGVKDETLNKLQQQVTCLSGQVIDLENELEKISDDREIIKADLEAMKDLCEKLDLQRDKLNAEIEECMKIRKQLESDNQVLRKDLVSVQSGDKTVIESLRELLSTSREELDEQRKISKNLNQEVTKLKEKISELQEKLILDREESKRHEALAREYSVQIQELRHSMANDRFEMARSREESARIESNFKPKEDENQDCCEINNLDAEITGIVNVNECTPTETCSKDKSEIESRKEILSKMANFSKMEKPGANSFTRRTISTIQNKTKIPTKNGRMNRKRNVEPHRPKVDTKVMSEASSKIYLRDKFDVSKNIKKLSNHSIKGCPSTNSSEGNKENSILHRSVSSLVQKDSKGAIETFQLSSTKSDSQFRLENGKKSSDLLFATSDRNEIAKSVDPSRKVCTETTSTEVEGETNTTESQGVMHDNIEHSSTSPQKHSHEMEAEGSACIDAIQMPYEQPVSSPNYTLSLMDHILEPDNEEVLHKKYVTSSEPNETDVCKTPSTSSFDGCECMREKYKALKKLILQK